VQVLNDALVESKYDAWVDWEDIPLTADWWAEIEAGIEGADTFIFVISPDSIASKVCRQEIDHAVANHKRLVPVVRREGFDMALVHPELGKANWLFFKEDSDFDVAFQSLVAALDTDLAHVKEHTRLLVKALDWDKRERRDDLLLRGRELEEVIQWLTQNAEKDPRSTQLQRDYINASRLALAAEQQTKLEHEATVRKRITRALIAAVGGLVVAVGLGAAAFQQFRRAEAQRQEAVQAEVEALVSSANALLDSEQPLDALIESLRAANQLQTLDDKASDMNHQVVGILHRAIAETQEINRLSEHSHWVHAVAFSPKENVFATTGEDGAVRIWHKQGQLMATVEGQQGESSTALNFSPDGKTLAVAINQHVKLLDLKGNIIGWLPGHGSRINQVNFSSDGQLLATAALDGTIGLWNHEGELLQLIQGHSEHAYDVQFSPDKTTLVSSGGDGLIRFWTYDGELLRTFSGHTGIVKSFAFSPDYSTLASASFDGTVRLWDRSGALMKTFEIETDNILTRVRFHPDGKSFVVATGEKNVFRTSVKLWDIEGTEIQRFAGHGSRITDASFSPDGEFIVSTSFDSTIRLWQTDQEKLVTSVQGHTDKVTSLTLSPDGKTLASSGQDGNIILWDWEGQVLETLDSHSEAVNTTVFSPIEDTLLSASDDKTINVWKLNGELQKTLEGHEAEIKSLSVSPDGKFWASVSEDGNVKLWTSQGEFLKELTVDEGYADIVRFHPEAPLIAVAVDQFNQANRNVLLWDWQKESIMALNPIGKFAITDMHFSPIGDFLAVASWHGNISFWNLAGEKLSSFFAGHAGPVNVMQFRPDGSAIAVGSQSLMLFNLQGELQQMLDLPEQGEISSLAFETDGQKVVSGQTDGSIFMWNMDATELIQKGCQRLENYLASHPETLVELSLCQTPSRLTQAANTLIRRGEILALQGDEIGAVGAFKRALELNPQAELVPEEMAALLARKGRVFQLIEEGDRLARQSNRSAALEKYQAAITMDSTFTFDANTRFEQEETLAAINQLIDEGQKLAKQGDITAAQAKFQAAKDQEPNLALDPARQARYFAADSQFGQAQTALNKGDISEAITAITKVQQLDSSLLARSPAFLSDVCQQSSLDGRAESVITICNKAVSLASDQPAVRDSRGLARALTGDIEGAIADFQFFIDHTSDEEAKVQRQQWIEALKAGENPFTPKVLESLQ